LTPLLRIAFTTVFAYACLPAISPAADRLILRNLDIITDRTVTAFDEDGMVLDAPRQNGSNRITWDEIERGKIALDQARFEQLLAELGPPLYRIRQRLKIGDYVAAGEPAESLYARYGDHKSQTAYMVCQATMWSRLARGQREAAVEPLLRCYDLLRSRAASGTALPGARRLQVDVATALSTELDPVWFDAQAARSALVPVQQVIRAMAQPRPVGAYVYYASLAASAGDSSESDRVMPLIEADPSAGYWPLLIRGQQEITVGSPGPAINQLRRQLNSLPPQFRPLGLLLVGLADSRSTDEETRRSGTLLLLTLPAAYDQSPELAAAGLYYAADTLAKLNDGVGSASVRRELFSRYASTYFGILGRATPSQEDHHAAKVQLAPH
jgi:hypothetical protein